MLFGGAAAGYIVASQINSRILPIVGSNILLRVAVRTFAVATLVLLVDALTGFGGLLGIYLPIMVAMFTNGFNNPNTTVGAMSKHATRAGSASAVMGTGQFLLGAASGALVGVLDDGTARPMGALMAIGGIGAVIADLLRPRPEVVAAPAEIPVPASRHV
jgi:DHA1 family bicyclomycin/chloramphenicol resistance-like MFS transporter